MSPSRAIIIGAGIGGLLTSLVLAKRKWTVRLIDEHAGRGHAFELPYICSHLVSDFLKREVPEVYSSLLDRGARNISIAEILRSRFSEFEPDSRDEQIAFLCCSRSLLQQVLFEHVEKRGIEVVKRKVTGLLKDHLTPGVVCEGTKLNSEIVIDVTGSAAPRAQWFKDQGWPTDNSITAGPSYVSLACFYEKAKSAPGVQFALASGRHFRGGIYPLEHDRFAIALIVPETLELGRPEDFFRAATDLIPGAKSTWLAGAQPWNRDLQVVRGIRNRFSDFYDSPHASRHLPGFFPIGDSIMTGNPIYGRGVSYLAIHLAALLAGLDDESTMGAVHSRIAVGVRQAHRFWVDGAFADRADESPTTVDRKLRRYLRDTFVATVITQLESDPQLTKNFLYNYQLMLPAWRITGPRQYWTALKRFSAMTS